MATAGGHWPGAPYRAGGSPASGGAAVTGRAAAGGAAVTTGRSAVVGGSPVAGRRGPGRRGEHSRPLSPPCVHDLTVLVAAPTVLVCRPDGDLDAGAGRTFAVTTAPYGGGQAGSHGLGVFHEDVRVLSRLRLTIGGQVPHGLLTWIDGPGRLQVVAVTGETGIRIDRRRTLAPGLLSEEITLTSSTGTPVRTTLRLDLGCDLATLGRVLTRTAGGRRRPALVDSDATGMTLGWSGTGVQVAVRPVGPGSAHAAVRTSTLDAGTVDSATASLAWPVEFPAGGSATVAWQLTARGRPDVHPLTRRAAPAQVPWSVPVIVADDARLAGLLRAALDDLGGLRMTATDRPGDEFLVAGGPWALDLVATEALWSARMLLPLGTTLARGTLRALSRLQGDVEVPETGEQPGLVPHEVTRALPTDAGGGARPGVGWGDPAPTALWVCLLHDAWRWGMATDEVQALLPAMESALRCLARAATGPGPAADPDSAVTGLVTGPDGTAAAEVQGYAHEAALDGAALLTAFGLRGAAAWRSWARALAERFRQQFWHGTGRGRHLVPAIDATGAPAAPVTTSVAAHLLGSGLLDADEWALVAGRLARVDLVGGFGLRTWPAGAEGFGTLRPGHGAVRPLDTAVAVTGLLRGGHGAAAAPLIEGLLRAGTAFGGRLPELWSGDARDAAPAPVPHPAAGTPYAVAAASLVGVLGAVLGLEPDVPSGRLRVRAPRGGKGAAGAGAGGLGAIEVRGLRLADRPLHVVMDGAGRVRVRQVPAGVAVEGDPEGTARPE